MPSVLVTDYSSKDKPKKDKNGLSVTEIIGMSQEITDDWLQKEAEKKVSSSGAVGKKGKDTKEK